MIRKYVTFSLLLALAIVGCASPSNQTTDESDQVVAEETPEESGPEDWKPIFHDETPDLAPLREAEAEAVEYFATANLALHSLSLGRMDLLKKQLQSKGEKQQRVETFFFRAMEADGVTASAKTHAAFRISQMYFDFACQLRALRMPEGLHEALKARYFAVLHQDFIVPLFSKSRQAFSKTARFGARPWASEAEALVDAIPMKTESMTPAEVARICQDYRRVWASPASLLRANRAMALDAQERSTSAEDDVQDSDVKEDESQAHDERSTEAGDDAEGEIIVGRGGGPALEELRERVGWEPMPLGFDEDEFAVEADGPDGSSTGDEDSVDESEMGWGRVGGYLKEKSSEAGETNDEDDTDDASKGEEE